MDTVKPSLPEALHAHPRLQDQRNLITFLGLFQQAGWVLRMEFVRAGKLNTVGKATLARQLFADKTNTIDDICNTLHISHDLPSSGRPVHLILEVRHFFRKMIVIKLCGTNNHNQAYIVLKKIIHCDNPVLKRFHDSVIF